MKLIVGLGNPGGSYRWTRHNAGFLLLDALAEKHSIELSKKGLKSLYGRGTIGKEDVLLAEPQTFMNLSGEAVGGLLRFFKIPFENLIVFHDDLDLPFGKIRIRLRGGHGGHKGIQSIIENLAFNEFVRLKMGIGRPENPGQDPADFVLQSLSDGEKKEFREMISRTVEVAECVLLEGPQEAMNRYHIEREAQGNEKP